ncbi:N-acyl-D-amino-acid deacylase family protein [Trujillonella endophytica]|uniref:N-acyl-D-aspartate/D-glutamate deacylase n=1 Tax=Trujillonella endophytica TaxID=673521 RepID=A0A1H8SUP4_9ACTN|nr:amidohydrolase family protein [Trujillella endophytica]SEO82412.1 N-acyl-D-aspartate/D-glutamate deacylase [Trujillella endophytica]
MTVIRGGLLADGTGAPARPADVRFEGATIAEIGPPGTLRGDEEVDAGGLVVAPGFVDIHTHYDAQVLWDPDLTPSSWHGVTTVVMGNCGFGIAPTRPDGREIIARTLENVEGMSLEALTAGIDWSFESFPEYLDAVERARPRLNVAAMLGHTPLRLAVLGPDAMERAASDEEIATMAALVDEALAAGAVGFASSRQPAHAGAYGRPVPSRLASLGELRTLASALTRAGRGVLALTRGPDLDIEEIAELSEAIGRPTTWTALMASHGGADPLEMVERGAARGSVVPQVACRPVVMQATLAEPFPFARIPAFAEVLGRPAGERAAVYRDPAWRSRAHADTEQHWPALWGRMFVQETVAHPELADGPSLAELAAARGVRPVDVLCDVALDDDLRTRFRQVQANDDEDGVAALLRDERTVLGLSDAGAHANQLCDAVFATHLLGYWVREKQVLTLEQAVWRLTGQPAELFGLRGRGRLVPGAAADVVLFDPATVGVGPMQRVRDLPAGADRLVAPSTGIEGVWVNGERIRDADGPTQARPGRVLRDR